MFRIIKSNGFPCVLLLVIAIVAYTLFDNKADQNDTNSSSLEHDSLWYGSSIYIDLPHNEKERELVLYGRDLIANTSNYLGPRGSVAQISNGMNCQNCHLDAGNRPWGNNYGAVASTYPKFRERSGTIEGIYKRINDCINRSLNGKALDTSSVEMLAMCAYIKWIGKDVKKGTKPIGTGLEKLTFLDRAASPDSGQIVYRSKCQSCHGATGEGKLNPDKKSYTYPPLWGVHSFNDGAGLYRVSNFAGFVKNNMPYGEATHNNTILNTEQAWDVAAYVNSQPRPHLDQSSDYPEISTKPIDFPTGPFADTFSPSQHKYGPFGPIAEMRARAKQTAINKN